MTGPIVSVEIGRSTWQGPAEEAPGRAGNRDADMAECFAFSAGYEAGERDGRASGQQVRALEWYDCADGSSHDHDCQYEIEQDGKQWRLVRASTGPGGYLSHHQYRKGAKEAAQADYERRILSSLMPAPQPEGHPDDLAVDRFAAAMKAKLAKKRAEGRGGWDRKDECSAEDLSYMLVQHLWKGDPLDVGNLAMMLHQRGERIVLDGEGKSIAPQPEGMVRAMWPRWRAMLLDESPIPGAAIKEMDAAFAALSSGEGRDDE